MHLLAILLLVFLADQERLGVGFIFHNDNLTAELAAWFMPIIH